jgi:hypothetical protein
MLFKIPKWFLNYKNRNIILEAQSSFEFRPNTEMTHNNQALKVHFLKSR